jgi:hypothetical protein
LRNTYKWLASRSILGGFATAGSLSLMMTYFPPGSMRDSIAHAALLPATALTRAYYSFVGEMAPPSPGGIFNGFGVLFYCTLWYVLLSVIVQIKGE